MDSVAKPIPIRPDRIASFTFPSLSMAQPQQQYFNALFLAAENISNNDGFIRSSDVPSLQHLQDGRLERSPTWSFAHVMGQVSINFTRKIYAKRKEAFA